MEPISKDDALFLATLLLLGESFTHAAWVRVRETLEGGGLNPSGDISGSSKAWVDCTREGVRKEASFYITDKGKETLANYNKEKQS